MGSLTRLVEVLREEESGSAVVRRLARAGARRLARVAPATARPSPPSAPPPSPPSPPSPLQDVATTWEAQAQADPLWAVLSEPDKRGRRWSLEEFLESGREQVEHSLSRFEALGGVLPRRQTAVDFGCGVGRLTQPLAGHFEHVIGIDISPTMVAIARRLNRFGERVSYVVNEKPDLSFLGDRSVNLVFSHITLQHLPTEVAKGYLDEFFRVLEPGGGLIFQLPSHLTDEYLAQRAHGEPVPEAASTARVRADVPSTIAANDVMTIKVQVHNLSDHDWHQAAGFPLNVGSQWRDAAIGAAVGEGARAELPSILPAGGSTGVDLDVMSPDRPGRYRLRIGVVQDGVAWFTEGPEAYVDVAVDVAGRDLGAAGEYAAFGDLLGPSASAPRFEMHGIHIDEVKGIIADHGATLLATDEWLTEWHSFAYFVQTPSE
jgi:SAM-dependent methyltransferase